MENKEQFENEELAVTSSAEEVAPAAQEDVPLDKTVKLMSPMQMVLRRFFRSKLSILGMFMVIGLFLFSFVGPLFFADRGTPGENGNVVYDPNDGKWGEIELDESGKIEYTKNEVTVTLANGETVVVKQTIEKNLKDNLLSPPSSEHIMGTDNEGYDIFVRLMYGGRISLTVSFITVIIITILGVVLGGIAGYFGGWVDGLIMRICDVLGCLPGIPILLIISTLLDAAEIDAKYRIYLLMMYLTLFSWTGVARLVRGQILSLREQEYMVAAEAMGYSVTVRSLSTSFPTLCPS